MSVVADAVEEISDRLGAGAPTELLDFIQVRLERMYVWGRRDMDVRFRRREAAMARNLRELEATVEALKAQLLVYERERRGT